MDLVRIIHPDTGNTAEVATSALPFMYASGWRVLADDEATEPDPAETPPPVTRAQLAKARTTKPPPAPSDPGPSKSAESEGK